MMRALPPRQLREADVGDLSGDLAKLTMEYVSNHSQNRQAGAALFLYGPEGVGKSHVAAAVHCALAKRGWQLFWLDCADWPSTFEESRELAQDASVVTALVLDDVGREPKAMRPDVARVITRRFSNSLWTVYTTNLNVDTEDVEACDLSRYYARALRSRMLGQADVVLMDGEDRRDPNG